MKLRKLTLQELIDETPKEAWNLMWDDDAPITLDKYHWHEALHMADSLQMMIEKFLIQHPTYKEMCPEVQESLAKAQEKLYLYYLACCEKQSDLEE